MTSPGYAFFPVQVRRTERLGPTFLRITFTGDDLGRFGAAGNDQRIKLVLPPVGSSTVALPVGDDWHAAWLSQPEHERPVLRTYTVRAARPTLAEVDVDVVLHHRDAGAASRWAAAAEPGSPLVLLGPDRPGSGRPWGVEWAPPPGVQRLLVAGDETAVPAVAAVLEGLPADATGTVLLEVPHAGDVQPLRSPDGVAVHWLPRGRAGHGALLVPAVRAATANWGGAARVVEDVAEQVDLWEVPERPGGTGVYAWLAGEAGVVRALRRLLVGERGLPRDAVAFMGYWRAGHPG